MDKMVFNMLWHRAVRILLPTTAALAALLGSAQAWAQGVRDPQCLEVLRSGVYTALVDRGNAARASEVRRQLCESLQRASSEGSSSGSGLTVGIPGVGNLGFSGSDARQQAQSFASLMCDASSDASQSSNQWERVVNSINAPAYAAYQECLRLSTSAVGLRTTFNLREDSERISVSIFVGGTGAVRVTGMTMSPPGVFHCFGPLADLANQLASGADPRTGCTNDPDPRCIRNEQVTMTCDRVVERSGDVLIAPSPRVTLTIQTNSGNLDYEVPALKLPLAAVRGNVPVGAIEAFAGQTPPDGWISCDGREFDRARYAVLAEVLGGNRAPDLRGRFLRGANPGGDGLDPNRPVLSTQDWATGMPRAGFRTDAQGAHDHGAPWQIRYYDGVVGPNTIHEWPDDSANEINIRQPGGRLGADGNHTHTVTGGDAETRPANTAVHFIVFAGVSTR